MPVAACRLEVGALVTKLLHVAVGRCFRAAPVGVRHFVFGSALVQAFEATFESSVMEVFCLVAGEDGNEGN